MDRYSQADAVDDYAQEDPESMGHPVNSGAIGTRPRAKKRKRTGSKGNRREQARRYWLRHKARRLLYLRIYMRSYRARKRLAESMRSDS